MNVLASFRQYDALSGAHRRAAQDVIVAAEHVAMALRYAIDGILEDEGNESEWQFEDGDPSVGIPVGGWWHDCGMGETLDPVCIEVVIDRKPFGSPVATHTERYDDELAMQQVRVTSKVTCSCGASLFVTEDDIE